MTVEQGSSYYPLHCPSPYNFWAEKSTHVPANSIFSGSVSNRSTFNIVFIEIFSDVKMRTKKGVRISNFTSLSCVFKWHRGSERVKFHYSRQPYVQTVSVSHQRRHPECDVFWRRERKLELKFFILQWLYFRFYQNLSTS